MPSGSFGPLSLAASILGGSGMAAGCAGLGGGVLIAGALGRLVDGGEGGTWMRGLGRRASTLNSLLIFPRLGVRCVSSVGGAISGVTRCAAGAV